MVFLFVPIIPIRVQSDPNNCPIGLPYMPSQNEIKNGYYKGCEKVIKFILLSQYLKGGYR